MSLDNPSPTSPRLDTLPPEILLRVINFLPAQSIVRLSATSKSLRAIARDESIWRDIVQSIRRRDGGETDLPLVPDESEAEEGDELWWSRASFLLGNSQYLGWWVSSTPYTSRIIRLRTSLTLHTPLRISATQLTPTNAFSSPSTSYPLPSLPLGAILNPNNPTSYQVPRRGPGSNTPDAGLSVDLLEPIYSSVPLFTISKDQGAILSTTPYSALVPSQDFGPSLRLKLQEVQRRTVLSGEEEEEEEGGQSAEDRRRREGDALYAMFTGRHPTRPWPTAELVGPGDKPREDVTTARSSGAFRGLSEWMVGRGEEREVLSASRDVVVASSSSSSSKSFVTGFLLQVRRKATPPSTSTSPLSSTTPPPTEQQDDIPRRRRGVGPNGGPAILWNGQEADPNHQPGVALIRAGGVGGADGFLFRLQQAQDRLNAGAAVRERSSEEEEVVRTDREEMYPIKPPSRPISYHDPPTTDPTTGDILAESLEGLWVGTYGSHGLEYGHISINLTPPTSTISSSLTGGSTSWTRSISFVKATGDANVPSGQISWSALLPLPSPSSTSHSSLGTISTILSTTLLHWSSLPSSYTGPNPPDWSLGTYEGRGRVALSGFVSPGWTKAEIVFVRSLVVVEDWDGEGEGEGKRKEVETVEEIRVRWKELGKVGVFRRVRVE